MELGLGCACADGTPGYEILGVGSALEEKQPRALPTLTARYCGLMVSNNSNPIGTPKSVKSQSNCLAMRRPLLILKEPSISGSLMRPFQPTVVRGFSLYTGMNTTEKSKKGRFRVISQVTPHDNE